jgi:hypothetical protein
MGGVLLKGILRVPLGGSYGRGVNSLSGAAPGGKAMGETNIGILFLSRDLRLTARLQDCCHIQGRSTHFREGGAACDMGILLGGGGRGCVNSSL